MMIDLLLQSGHEIVYENTEEVQERRSRANGLHLFTVYDECREYQRDAITQFSCGIHEREVLKIKNNPGPRDRWGKVK